MAASNQERFTQVIDDTIEELAKWCVEDVVLFEKFTSGK